jgi:ferredoxin
MTYIITETCVGCGTCVSECPVDAISEGEPYAIDAGACVDCGQCADICPVDAIYRKM